MSGPEDDGSSAQLADNAVLDSCGWVPSGPDSPFTGSTDD